MVFGVAEPAASPYATNDSLDAEMEFMLGSMPARLSAQGRSDHCHNRVFYHRAEGDGDPAVCCSVVISSMNSAGRLDSGPHAPF